MPRHGPGADPDRLTTLLHLVKLGAVRSYETLSTRKLGEAMGLSQQAASLRILDLERAGLIERARSGRGVALRLTDDGLEAVDAFLADIGANLERGKDALTFKGTVFTGLNEGAYYVSLKGYASSFESVLGFRPFPGTLNLRLTNQAMIEQRRKLELMKGLEIPGFSDGKRTFGPVKCFRAKVGARHPGAVLAIRRTHYDATVLEVISPVNLRRALGLKDGDECSVIAHLGQGWVRRR